MIEKISAEEDKRIMRRKALKNAVPGGILSAAAGFCWLKFTEGGISQDAFIKQCLSEEKIKDPSKEKLQEIKDCFIDWCGSLKEKDIIPSYFNSALKIGVFGAVLAAGYTAAHHKIFSRKDDV